LIRRSGPVNQALNNRHLCLLELLLGIATSGMGEVDGMANLDVVSQGDILDFDTNKAVNKHASLEFAQHSLLGVPLAKKLDLTADF